jgi:hypothetical protein
MYGLAPIHAELTVAPDATHLYPRVPMPDGRATA